MLTQETLAVLLAAVATGYEDRAHNFVQTSEDFTDEQRGQLAAILRQPLSAGSRLSAIGDVLRVSGTDPSLVNETYRAAFFASSSWTGLLEDDLFTFAMADRSGAVLDKWPHYFPIYSRHLGRFRGRVANLLEIGVYRGGGLDMWKWFFGPSATLVGIDIDEVVQQTVGRRHTVVIGDQEDPAFLQRVSAEFGPFDIVIDDGGHTMRQQIVSTETLFPLLKDGGVYLVEDCHTSYWPEYGGRFDAGDTFLAWVKGRVDSIHGYHVRDGADHVDEVWTRQLSGLHVYDSVVVLDKSERFAPFSQQTGTLDHLFLSRIQSDVQSELLATRDAALAQRDAALAEVDAASAALAEAQTAGLAELRLARSEVASLRVRLSDLEEEVERCHSDLYSSWQHVREIRESVSWRVTAPLRRIRSPRTGS